MMRVILTERHIMTIFKPVLCAALLCMAAPALTVQADTDRRQASNYQFPTGSATVRRFSGENLLGIGTIPLSRLGDRQFRINGASETASYYYITGIRQFEKENYDRAERAFKAVLRADGLNKAALHYLVAVSVKKGDTEQAKVYAERWAELHQRSKQ